MQLYIPDRCIPLLREQRTHYTDLSTQYGEELQRTYESFRAYLPFQMNHVLDIGSGMAGIDVLLGRHAPRATLHLLDKQGVSPTINAGFNASADQFAHYNDFDSAIELLRENGIRNTIRTYDMNRVEYPQRPYDVVISLLSWGFHYPISTYDVDCIGTMIVDCRKGTDSEDQLSDYGKVTVVHEGRKFRRVLEVVERWFLLVGEGVLSQQRTMVHMMLE
jgi:hypothetical protein